MNKKYKFPLLVLSCLLATANLAACGDPGAANIAEEPPLAGAALGGDFTLTDQDGEKVSFSDFKGQYRILYFGYSFCPDVCPVDLQQLMMGLNLFAKEHPERAANIQPIFVTLDPARDTPEALKEYVTAFHPRLIGLTGSEEEIAGAAAKYLIIYRKEEPNSEGGYLVSHTNQPYLIGPDGEPLAILPVDARGDVAQAAQDIAAEIDRWSK